MRKIEDLKPNECIHIRNKKEVKGIAKLCRQFFNTAVNRTGDQAVKAGFERYGKDACVQLNRDRCNWISYGNAGCYNAKGFNILPASDFLPSKPDLRSEVDKLSSKVDRLTEDVSILRLIGTMRAVSDLSNIASGLTAPCKKGVGKTPVDTSRSVVNDVRSEVILHPDGGMTVSRSREAMPKLDLTEEITGKKPEIISGTEFTEQDAVKFGVDFGGVEENDRRHGWCEVNKKYLLYFNGKYGNGVSYGFNLESGEFIEKAGFQCTDKTSPAELKRVRIWLTSEAEKRGYSEGVIIHAPEAAEGCNANLHKLARYEFSPEENALYYVFDDGACKIPVFSNGKWAEIISKPSDKPKPGETWVSGGIQVLVCTGSPLNDNSFCGVIIYSEHDDNYRKGEHSVAWDISGFKELS